VYWQQASEPYGELVLDNGGIGTTGWSTPLDLPKLSRFDSWTILGSARVSAQTNWVRVMQGNPATFASLFSSTNLKVGGLIVSNTWVFGDIMDLEITRATDAVRLMLCGETNRPHILQSSPDLTNWTPLITNVPVNSFFEFLDTNVQTLDRRFYRGVKP